MQYFRLFYLWNICFFLSSCACHFSKHHFVYRLCHHSDTFPKWVSVTSSFNQLRACMTKTIFLKTKIYGFGKYTKWSDGWLLEINPWMKAISIVKNRCSLPVWLIDTCRQFNCHSRTRTTLIDWIKFGQNCEIWSKLWCLLH